MAIKISATKLEFVRRKRVSVVEGADCENLWRDSGRWSGSLPGALLVAWSGVSDIAASQGHYAFVERFLEFGMRNAVATHARGIEAPQLENPNLIRLGAGHFHRGCAFCHGPPGLPVNPIAKHMLPSPPDLAVAMRPWKERELFWIVKHGFKYTGMPGWVALERDDEIWAVVAFLKLLPTLDAKGYRSS